MHKPDKTAAQALQAHRRNAPVQDAARQTAHTQTPQHKTSKPEPGGAAGVVQAHAGEDLMLLPGQMYFGREAARVRTLLGSCVALTLWSPARRIGGMCHYLLPERRRAAEAALDARYGNEAIALMLAALRRAGTQPGDYEAHLYGGADTMPDQAGVKLNIGERNIELGWAQIEHHGFRLVAVDVGDHVPRHVSMTMADGQVAMRRGAATAARG